MDRREFTATGLSSLLTYTCLYARSTAAKPILQGCRMAATNDDEWSDTRTRLRSWSGFGPMFDDRCNECADALRTSLGVRPGFSFFEDGTKPNAFAVPHAYFPDQGPDGTVMLGIQLISRITRDYPEFRSFGPTFGVIVVMAHEFGHILQFKEGVSDSWEMEPHADFMAGWVLAQFTKPGAYNPSGGIVDNLPGMVADFNGYSGPLVGCSDQSWRVIECNTNRLEQAVRTMFSFGDTEFNDPDHHGEPQFRAVLVRAGYEAGNLGVKEAFEKGMVWTNLNREPK